MNSESAGSRATICASDSPVFVYCDVFLPPNARTVSAVHCPLAFASIALPLPLKLSSTICCSAGYSLKAPLMMYPMTPAIGLPSTPESTELRSAGGAPT